VPAIPGTEADADTSFPPLQSGLFIAEPRVRLGEPSSRDRDDSCLRASARLGEPSHASGM